MAITKVPICPIITYDFLDDAPAYTGDPNGDPFVVGDMTTGALASYVKAKVYGRIAQNPVDDDTPASKSVNSQQTFVIDVYWKLTGSLVPAFCGNWNITIYFESMGPDEYDFEIILPAGCSIPYGCPQPPKQCGCPHPPEQCGCQHPPEQCGCQHPPKQCGCQHPPEQCGCQHPPNTDRNTRIYHARYNVPAGTVKTEPNGTPYEVNLSVVLLSPCDQKPSGLVGFVPLEDVLFL